MLAFQADRKLTAMRELGRCQSEACPDTQSLVWSIAHEHASSGLPDHKKRLKMAVSARKKTLLTLLVHE